MKIKLLSDLHLEGRQGYFKKPQPWAIRKDEDVLVLAGDIAVGVSNTVQALSYFYDLGYPKIIYVAGNHESYHSLPPNDFIQQLKAAIINPSIHILNCEEVVNIQGTSFFGGTLWTNFNNSFYSEMIARDYISDFKVIPDFTTKDAAKIYERQLAFIKDTYATTEGPKVIVTHFLPAVECIHPRFHNSPANDYFATNNGEWISTLTDTLWLFGHTHDYVYLELNEARLIANPLGYSNQPSTFKDLCITSP